MRVEVLIISLSHDFTFCTRKHPQMSFSLRFCCFFNLCLMKSLLQFPAKELALPALNPHFYCLLTWRQLKEKLC